MHDPGILYENGFPVALARILDVPFTIADATTLTEAGYVGDQPISVQGRLAVARVLLDKGDRAGASREVRAVWQSSELSAELETAIANAFPGVLTVHDDIARMNRRIGAKDFGAAMRTAKRLGSADVAIVKACEAADATPLKAQRCSRQYQRQHAQIWAMPCAAFTGCWHRTISPRRLSC